jgi:hypothetical protein
MAKMDQSSMISKLKYKGMMMKSVKEVKEADGLAS